MAKYKRNDLAAVNELGARYAQNPTQELGAELLDLFEGFIQSYVTLLSPTHKSKVKLTKNTKAFLRLFAKKSDFDKNGSNTYQIVLKRLPNMAVQSLYDDDDLRNSIIVAFLNTAQNFDPAKCGANGTFTGYIDTHFKWALKPLLFDSHEDAAKHQPLHEEAIEEQSFFGHDVEYEEGRIRIHNGHEIVDDTLVDMYIDLPVLSLSFVSAPVEPYDTLLTKQERIVMVKILVDDKSPSAVAAELDYSNTTVVRNIWSSAITKIRNHLHLDIEEEPPCSKSEFYS